MSRHGNGHVCHSFLDVFLAVEYRKLIFVQLYTILKLEYVVFQIAAFGEKYHYGDRKKNLDYSTDMAKYSCFDTSNRYFCFIHYPFCQLYPCWPLAENKCKQLVHGLSVKRIILDQGICSYIHK